MFAIAVPGTELKIGEGFIMLFPHQQFLCALPSGCTENMVVREALVYKVTLLLTTLLGLLKFGAHVASGCEV